MPLSACNMVNIDIPKMEQAKQETAWSHFKSHRICKEVTEETSLCLLLEAQDQQLDVEQDQLPCGPT